MGTSILQTWSADRIAECCGGELFGRGDLCPTGMSNDGRTIGPGQLFVALKAERDGHEFIDQARKRGANIFLVAKDRRQGVTRDEAFIAVDDTYVGLANLARAIWKAHQIEQPDRVSIAVTGSNGKTTTTQLIKHILEQAYPGRVLGTSGNLNNHIGLPLTVSELGSEHQFVVLEMGASYVGDIALLVGITPIVRAVVTSLSAAHVAGFGGYEQIVAEKGAIFRGEPRPSVAVCPSANAGELMTGAEVADVRLIGEEASCWGSITQYVDGAPSRISIQLNGASDGPDGPLDFQLPLVGRHNAHNLATAVAACWDVLPKENRVERLIAAVRSASAAKSRLNIKKTATGAIILDDTYNANPASMKAALMVLGDRVGKRWAILGDMLELGPVSEEAHHQIGRAAAEADCARVWGVGQWAETLVVGASSQGVSDTRAFRTTESCVDALTSALSGDQIVLVKGSRGIHLEDVVARLSALDGETVPSQAKEES